MLNVVMLKFIMLSIAMLNVVMLNVAILSGDGETDSGRVEHLLAHRVEQQSRRDETVPSREWLSHQLVTIS